VYQALQELGFEKYVEQLRDFMQHYNAEREDVVDRTGVAKKRTFAATANGEEVQEEDAAMDGDTTANAKRKRQVEYADDEEDCEVIDIKHA
jgi:hypothetical protein